MFLIILIDVTNILYNFLISQILERLLTAECQNLPQHNAVHPYVRLWCEFTLNSEITKQLISLYCKLPP